MEAENIDVFYSQDRLYIEGGTHGTQEKQATKS